MHLLVCSSQLVEPRRSSSPNICVQAKHGVDTEESAKTEKAMVLHLQPQLSSLRSSMYAPQIVLLAPCRQSQGPRAALALPHPNPCTQSPLQRALTRTRTQRKSIALQKIHFLRKSRRRTACAMQLHNSAQTRPTQSKWRARRISRALLVAVAHSAVWRVPLRLPSTYSIDKVYFVTRSSSEKQLQEMRMLALRGY